MSEWKEYRLGDLGTVITGKTPSAHNPEDWGDNMLFITPSDYRNYRKYATNSERKLSKVGMDRLEKKILPANSILVTCIGSDMGKVVINGEQCVTNQQINAIVPNTSVNNDFLYYRLISIYDTLRMYGGDGTAVPIVNKNDFENIKIEIPQLDEQKRIASILSSLDDKIDLLNRENATLEAMAETLFRQWFIEDAKEDWEEVTLEDVALLNAGGDKPKIVSQNRTKELNVPIYSNGIDNEGLYGYTDKPRITEESVTISARGTIGYVALRTAPFVPIVRLITIRPKERVTSKFLYFWAKSQDINGTGTTQQQLTVPDFKLTKLVLPDKAVIDDFTKIVNQYYDKIISNKKQIQTLIYTRDGLLPKLMSNEMKM